MEKAAWDPGLAVLVPGLVPAVVQLAASVAAPRLLVASEGA